MLIIKNDLELDIATGKHHKQQKWVNKGWKWSELLNRIQVTDYTHESHEEYMTATKERQTEIKDVGGFVGGYLTSGKRNKNTVLHRQLVTLDIDFPIGDIWQDYLLTYGHAAAVYSTHKHSPDNPRLRLLIPLDRPVNPDEYGAISRRIAGTLGIEAFDTTTFEINRLMFWPSTSKGSEYYFNYVDGPVLTADEVLATYVDWRDVSAWPISERFVDSLHRAKTKQGSPLEKKGLIGGFCKAYSIEEAIAEFLSEVYAPTTTEGRYTYIPGSTPGGLVVYDDIFAYSHHGSDPTSGQLCNAFDLVRIHKYGTLDEDFNGKKDIAKNLPSYKAMLAMCSENRAVKKILGRELFDEAREDFGTAYQTAPLTDTDAKALDVEIVEAEDLDMSWMDQLKMDTRSGTFASCIHNILVILRHDPNLKNKFIYDEFNAGMVVTGDLPWRKVIPGISSDFSDDDVAALKTYLESIKIPFTLLETALQTFNSERRIHPVKEYLNSLEWDGKERLESILIRYLGAADTSYIREATRKSLVAAVNRIYQPGTKFDSVVVLTGVEGKGKSELLTRLAGAWFSDCLGDIHKPAGMESLRSIWLMEIAELSAFKGQEQEAIKRFISSTKDIYRPAYGRRLVKFPRQCIFWATTNQDEYLKGTTGNRRFWPIRILVNAPTQSLFKHLDAAEVAQIWAEARTYYLLGESLMLSPESEELAAIARGEHSEKDDRLGMIEEFLSEKIPVNWYKLDIAERKGYRFNETLKAEATEYRSFISIIEIWTECFHGNAKDLDYKNKKFIKDILTQIDGWSNFGTVKRLKGYGNQRVYERTNTFKMTKQFLN